MSTPSDDSDSFVEFLESGAKSGSADPLTQAFVREFKDAAASMKAMNQGALTPLDTDALAHRSRMKHSLIQAGTLSQVLPKSKQKEPSNSWVKALLHLVGGQFPSSGSRAGFAFGSSALAYGAALLVVIGIGFVPIAQPNEPTSRIAIRTGEKAPPTSIVVRAPEPKPYCFALENILKLVGGKDVTEGVDGSAGNCKVQFDSEGNAASIESIRNVMHLAGVNSELSGLVTVRVRAPTSPIPLWKHILNRLSGD